jgi:hypothetical protein
MLSRTEDATDDADASSKTDPVPRPSPSRSHREGSAVGGDRISVVSSRDLEKETIHDGSEGSRVQEIVQERG